MKQNVYIFIYNSILGHNLISPPDVPAIQEYIKQDGVIG